MPDVSPLYLQRQNPLGNIAATATTSRLAGLPAGKAGTVQTLKYMRQAANDAIKDPAQKIRELALSLVKDRPERRSYPEIVALHQFVRDQIRYVKDPQGLELVATPAKTLEYGQGDCDDKSTLLAALLKSIGHPVRFWSVGMNGAPLSHVLVETRMRDAWLPLETILPKPPGWRPSNVTTQYRLAV